MSCQRERLVRLILLISWQSEVQGSEVGGRRSEGRAQRFRVQRSVGRGQEIMVNN
jgi:hypothetical protein